MAPLGAPSICGAVGITGERGLARLKGHHGFVANRAATFLEFSYTGDPGQQEYYIDFRVEYSSLREPRL